MAANGAGNPMADPAQFLTALFTAGMSANGNANGHGAQQVPQQVPQQQAVQFMHQQMPNMGFPGFPGMQHPMFNQQNSGAGLMSVLTEALRLSSPIGSSPNDEEILVQTLYESESGGLTYRAALEGLQGINNHSASTWKDYYLDHRIRLDKLIEARREGTAGKGKGKQGEGRSRSPHPSKRKDRHREYDGPEPPRRPVPLQDGKFKFTAEDDRFMMAFIRYRARKKFTRSKSKLAEEMAEKGPHHSKASWRFQMGKHQSEIDRILDRIADDCRKEGRAHSSSSSSEDDEQNSSEDGYRSVSSYGDRRREDSDDEQDRCEMSEAGGRITDADKRVMARYIAPQKDWDIALAKGRWESFADKYTQRSISAWAEAYRNHRDSIDSLVDKYRRRMRHPKRRLSQTGTPSWSKSKSHHKKRRSDAGDEDYHYRRGR